MSYHRCEKMFPVEHRKLTSRPKTNTSPTKYDCRICQQNHALRKCTKFNKMKVAERRQLVERFKYCENCLAHSHLLENCRNKLCCRHCGIRHHTLLHCHERLNIHAKTAVPTASCGTVVPTVLPKVQLNDTWYPIRGLLNPGSEYSAIAQFLVDRHNLPVEKGGDFDWLWFPSGLGLTTVQFSESLQRSQKTCQLC